MTKSRNIRESREQARSAQTIAFSRRPKNRRRQPRLEHSTRGFRASLNPRRVALRALALVQAFPHTRKRSWQPNRTIFSMFLIQVFVFIVFRVFVTITYILFTFCLYILYKYYLFGSGLGINDSKLLMNWILTQLFRIKMLRSRWMKIFWIALFSYFVK